MGVGETNIGWELGATDEVGYLGRQQIKEPGRCLSRGGGRLQGFHTGSPEAECSGGCVCWQCARLSGV